MSWLYRQRTGELFKLVGTGYAGKGIGVNNPELQEAKNVGPIPRGKWKIGPAMEGTGHGPLVMALTPDNGTETFGRSGFLIHGDLVKHPGERMASEGCIILPRKIRELVATSGDPNLVVEE